MGHLHQNKFRHVKTAIVFSKTVDLPTPSMMNRISSSLCKCSVQNLAQFASKFGILPGATVNTSCHCVHRQHRADWVWDPLTVNHVHHEDESRQRTTDIYTKLAAITISYWWHTPDTHVNDHFLNFQRSEVARFLPRNCSPGLPWCCSEAGWSHSSLSPFESMWAPRALQYHIPLHHITSKQSVVMITCNFPKHVKQVQQLHLQFFSTNGDIFELHVGCWHHSTQQLNCMWQ